MWKACGCFALGLWAIATLCDGCLLLLMSVLRREAFHDCFCALLCKLCACLYARARQTIICGVLAEVALNKFIISHWGRNQWILFIKKREVRRSHLRIPRFLPKNRSGQMLFHRSGSGKVTISQPSWCVIVAFRGVFCRMALLVRNCGLSGGSSLGRCASLTILNQYIDWLKA